jgi:Glycosyltransferase family 87
LISAELEVDTSMRVGQQAWIGLAFLAVLLQGLVTLVAIWPPTIAVDFFQEWSSAREILAGRPAYPELREAVPRLLGVPVGIDPDTVLVNAHPPASILLGLPLAYLSYPAAVGVWRFLSMGLIWSCVIVIRRQLGPMPPALAPPLTVTSNPVALTIFQGQLNGVLLSLIVGAWWADRVGREPLAGVLVGLAGAIKLNPMLLLGYFAVRSRWRAVTAGVLAFMAANFLAVVILGPGVFREYTSVMSRVAEHRSGRTNAALPAIWAKLFYPAQGRPIVPLLRSPRLYQLGALASVVAVVIPAAVSISRAQSRSEKDRAFGLIITTLLLVGPLTWAHTLLMLMLPVAVMARDWPGWSKRSRGLFLVAVAAVWLMPYTLYNALAHFDSELANHETQAPPWITLTAYSYQCYALLILFALATRIAKVPKAPELGPYPDARENPRYQG